MLENQYCKIRQSRLLEQLQQWKLDAAVITHPRHAYYFCGYWPFWQHSCGFVLLADGSSWLCTANSPAKKAAADEFDCFSANAMGTLRQEQTQLLARKIAEKLASKKVERIGFDSAPAASVLLAAGARGQCIDENLWQLRRAKDPDEVQLMKRAIDCTEAMYRRAVQIIEPGISDLTVFSQLQAAAVQRAGEPLSDPLGNDYASGPGGGRPDSPKTAKAGELYVLDLGPAVKGYFADNCRAFSVDHQPTDAQMKAWTVLQGVFPIVEKMARPGARCREIFSAVDDYLKSQIGKGMPHHLGHGVGLQPHEYPHLNPSWDDTLIEGEIFTAEPGIYDPSINAGLRLENQYLVTADGVNNLTPFPMDLVWK